MPWHEHKQGLPSEDLNAWRNSQQKKDRSFVHGLLIGGMCAMIVCGIIFGYEYGQLINECRALAGLHK